MIEYIKVDFEDPKHGEDLIAMLRGYAQDTAGGGEDLQESVKENLFKNLRNFPTSLSFLAYEKDNPVGVINCFLGFSTFKAQPLMNIHDVFVKETHREKGISRALLREVEKEAKALGCCKMTLEVLENNHSALNSYKNFGFDNYELDPTMGRAMFMEKKL